jgi:O-antigen/teichoic acid export membrane protein
MILTNAGALISGSGLARVFSALAFMIIARRLGPDAFGQFASSLSIVGIISVLFSLGLDGWLLRNGGDDKSTISRSSAASLAIKGGLGLVWIAAIFLLAPLLNQDAFPAVLVYLAALAFLFDELTNTAISGFKVALKNNITMWLLMGSQLLLLLLTLLLLALDVSAAGYMTGRMLASGASAAVAVYLLLRYFGLYRQNLHLRQTLRETVPFAVSIALANIYAQADVTIVAASLGKTASGMYAPAITLARTLFLIPASFYGVMLPILSQAYRQQPSSVRPLAGRFLGWSAIMGVVLGLGTAALAHPIVRLIYGEQYTQSGDVLVVLSWVLAFRCLSFGLAAVIVAVGWQGRRNVIQAIAASFNVGVNILIVGLYGIIGVSWVYVATELLLVAGHLLLLARWYRHPQSEPAEVEQS